MQIFIIALFCCITLAEFVVATLQLPNLLRYSNELFSVAAAAYVLLAGTTRGLHIVATRYWVVFGTLAFVILSSVLSNSVGVGPVLSGMRFYLHAIPFFFLPAVYPFSESQLQTQLKWLMGIALLQLPVAGYQRWMVWSQGRFTGDLVKGTLLSSGVLSIFLISAALLLIGLFLTRRMGKVRAFLLFFLLLIPTSINETKATLLLLPLGLFITLLIGSPPGRRLAVAGWTAVMLTAFGALFIPVYNLMQTNNPYKKDLVEFFTDDSQLQKYLEAKNAGVGATGQVGRSDAIVIPVSYIARDPVTLAFGLGMGNASHSSLGNNFTGRYHNIFESFVITSFSVFILEIGVLGVALIFLLYFLVFADSVAVARRDEGLQGALATGWAGVVAVMLVATFYTTTHTFNSLAYLFWYFSGIVAARRMQLA
jgi:hypothetical protein